MDAGRPSLDAGVPLEASIGDAAILDGDLPDASIADASIDDAGVSDAGEPDAGFIEPASDEPLAMVVAATEAALGISHEPSTGQVIRTILGLMFLLALSWLGGLPRVRRLEERLGISQVVTSGLPFVGLGLLMHAESVNVLNDDVLERLTPLLQFGLGWIGFHTGYQFEARAMDDVPRGTGSVVVMLTSVPFVLISLVAAMVLGTTGLGPEHLLDWSQVPVEEQDAFRDALINFARDAILLGLAGALSAPIAEAVVKVVTRATQLARTVAVLDDVFGVFALALLAAWLRPESLAGWHLPGVGWLFITLGMAATLGLVVHFSLLSAESTGERTSLLLGSVALTAGLAGAASISPLVVCFLAGVVLRNVPGGNKATLEAAFTRLERPVYLLFLTIVGALWQIDDWRGWLLLVVFVLARVGGRYLGARAARRLPKANRPPSLEGTPDRELVLAPMGQLAIALVVTAQTLYDSQAVRAAVTAVIGGSIVSEILARFALRRSEEEARESRPSGEPEGGPATVVMDGAPAMAEGDDEAEEPS